MADAAVQGGQLSSCASFTGDGQDVEIWVTMMDAAAVSFRWSDETTAAAAKSKMKDVAASWLHSERLQERWFPNWKEAPLLAVAAVPAVGLVPAVPAAAARPLDNLRTALLKRFGPDVGSVAAVRAIVDLKQKTSETVDEFHDRVVIAMDRKNSHLPRAARAGQPYQDQLQRDIYTFFAGGVFEEHRTRVFGLPAPPTTVPDLMKAARNSESVMNEERRRKAQVTVSEIANTADVNRDATQPRAPAPATSQGEKVTGNQAVMEEFIDVLTKHFGRKTGSSNNNRPSNTNKSGSKGKKKGGSGDGPLLCWNCNRQGHFARSCPQNNRKTGGGNSTSRSQGWDQGN